MIKNLKTKKQILKRNKIFQKKEIIIFFTMIFLLTLVLLSFWPGIFTIDGKVQWEQIQNNYIKNDHPFFSTFFWWLLSRIWFNPTCLIVFQIILLSVIWTCICYHLKNENNLSKRWIYTVVICFIPIIFFYVITAWKDIIYSYMLLIVSLIILIGIKKNFNYSYKDIFILDIALAFVWSYRYNGIITSILLLVSIGLILWKHKLKLKKIIVCISMFIFILAIFKIPEKIMCHPENYSASNDIALYVIASLVKEDKIDNNDDLELIDTIFPIDELKKEYNPYVINPISFSKHYDKEKAKQHTKDLVRILIKYTFKHPITVIKHYLKADNLLIGLRYSDGYVYIYQFDYWETKYSGNFDGLVTPILKEGYKFYSNLINFSTGNVILRKSYLPAYPLYLSIFLMFLFIRKNKDKRYFLVLLPMIFNTISLIPINVAQDLRYVYINYLTLLLLVIPLLIFTKNIRSKNRIKIKVKENPKTLIIIPAYNEEDSIEKVANSVYEQNIDNCDVIVINDGSKDNTYEKAKKTKAIVIDSPNNLGIGGAVQTGYLYAKENNYDIAIQLDGDGQHDPKYINELIKEIKLGNDLVIGSRFIKKTNYDQTKSRMLGINLISFTIKAITKVKVYDTTSGYRAANKNIIEEFAKEYPYDYPEPCTNMGMIKKGYKIKEIPVEMKQRETGISSISPLKGAIYMFKVTLSILLMGIKE